MNRQVGEVVQAIGEVDATNHGMSERSAASRRWPPTCSNASAACLARSTASGARPRACRKCWPPRAPATRLRPAVRGAGRLPRAGSAPAGRRAQARAGRVRSPLPAHRAERSAALPHGLRPRHRRGADAAAGQRAGSHSGRQLRAAGRRARLRAGAQQSLFARAHGRSEGGHRARAPQASSTTRWASGWRPTPPGNCSRTYSRDTGEIVNDISVPVYLGPGTGARCGSGWTMPVSGGDGAGRGPAPIPDRRRLNGAGGSAGTPPEPARRRIAE